MLSVVDAAGGISIFLCFALLLFGFFPLKKLLLQILTLTQASVESIKCILNDNG